MPNLASPKKALRQTKRRTAQNQQIQTRVKTQVKKTRLALTDIKSEQASTILSQTKRSLDKAAKKGIIHPNKAARIKSRLEKRLAKNTQSKPDKIKQKPTTPKKPARSTKKTAKK